MKTKTNSLKITLGVFLLSTVFAFASNNDPIKKEKKKDKSEIAIVANPMELNEEYLTEVHENALQEEVKYLSGIVANYDVKESSKFEGRRKPFTTIFNTNKGFAEVTYDSKGRVMSAEKRLKNVKLPSQIAKLVFVRYQDWTIIENKYTMSYKQGFDVKKTYELKISKGDEIKKLKFKV